MCAFLCFRCSRANSRPLLYLHVERGGEKDKGKDLGTRIGSAILCLFQRIVCVCVCVFVQAHRIGKKFVRGFNKAYAELGGRGERVLG